MPRTADLEPLVTRVLAALCTAGFLAVALSVAVAAVPQARSGTASGLLNTGRMIGATMGIAILGALFAAFAGPEGAAGAGFLPGLRAAMLVGGSGELIGAVVAFAFIRSDSLKRKPAH